LSGNVVVTHAGPTPPAELRDLLEGTFGSIPAGVTDPLEVPPFSLEGDSLALAHDEVLTAFAVVKFNAPPPGHPDQAAFRAGMRVIDELLWQVLRTEQGLTYATWGGTSQYRQSWGYMYVSSPEPITACSLMADVMTRAIAEPFEEELLRGVVELQRTYDAMSGESMSSQCLILGSGWIEEGDWTAGYRFADAAARITPEEVRTALDTWVSGAGWGIVADTAAVPTERFRAWPIRPEGG
jgi:predicted Zn-dependent peptidase